MRGISEKLHTYIKLPAVFAVAVAALLAAGTVYVYAETYPGGEDNGKTSRLKQLSGDLATLGYGSTSNDPDWGADWNRISTSAQWQPDGNIGPSDVAEGKTFYNGSRTEQTGTAAFAGACPTQAWHDSHGSANAADNCSLTWPVASPAVAGDDKEDPRTGLVWSQCLRNTGGVIDFSASGCTIFSWDNSNTNNNGRTATELCSDRGNGWRLPTQKELMQAYIDGSYFNLTSPSAYHWSATEHSGVSAWSVLLSTGYTVNASKSNALEVRCVR